MKTLLQEFKELPIKNNKDNGRIIISYSIRGLKRGLCQFTPKPNNKELTEAINWLEKNNLSLPVGNCELKYLLTSN